MSAPRSRSGRGDHFRPAGPRQTHPRRMTIHDPDVVFTDLALAIWARILSWRLSQQTLGKGVIRSGVTIMAALASAAFFSAVFHAFFTAGTTTLAGFLAWMPVSLSIVVVSATLLRLALTVLFRSCRRPSGRRGSGLRGGVRRGVVLFVNESCSTDRALLRPGADSVSDRGRRAGHAARRHRVEDPRDRAGRFDCRCRGAAAADRHSSGLLRSQRALSRRAGDRPRAPLSRLHARRRIVAGARPHHLRVHAEAGANAEPDRDGQDKERLHAAARTGDDGDGKQNERAPGRPPRNSCDVARRTPTPARQSETRTSPPPRRAQNMPSARIASDPAIYACGDATSSPELKSSITVDQNRRGRRPDDESQRRGRDGRAGPLARLDLGVVTGFALPRARRGPHPRSPAR